MTTITKVSEITAQDVAEYLRLDEVDESELAMLNTMLGVAKQFIIDYTGQTDLDKYQTFVDAVYVLCQDMWDNRTMYVDKLNLNKVVQAILGMHSVNLL
jgi:hypothetical protein